MPPEQRPDPLELLSQQEVDRLPWLVPVRRSRMAADPFAFFRGAAVVMAADLAREPRSGLMVQLCGDAHLLNFGFYGSPELQLLFDITDFDETHPGPFEWDVIRLATSLVLAARSLGLSDKQQSKVCRRGVRAYAEAMASFAAMAMVPMCVSKPPFEELIDQRPGANLQVHLKQVVTDAVRRTSRQAVRKLCEVNSSGDLQFRHQPPLICRYAELPSDVLFGVPWRQRFDLIYAEYLKSVRPELRHLLSQFRMTDCAYKAVGVGSVGTRCSIGVLVGDHPDDVLVLQSKQAEPSVLAPHIDQPSPDHQGQRVVQGQRLMQTASDPFLGWTTTPEGKPFYWRQLRNWKGAVDVSQLDSDGLKDYGKLCGWTLAKAHARSGDRRALSACMGEPRTFAAQLFERALVHAQQTEQDHRALVEAIDEGRLEAAPSG
jgi:Uncharacterized protein conserved in bacteria (DUF2252)